MLLLNPILIYDVSDTSLLVEWRFQKAYKIFQCFLEDERI